MFGPQSIAVLSLLLAGYAVALWWLVHVTRPALRVVAGALAVLPAMLLGVAGVNRYYGYYQDWGGLVRDISGTPAPGVQVLPRSLPETQLRGSIERKIAQADGRPAGLNLELTVHGAASGLTRDVLVYLPREYFEGPYRSVRLPVIELLHGAPGAPTDWTGQLNVASVLESRITAGGAVPAVLVMPDTNGGRDHSLQCLNVAHGPRDEDFLAADLITEMARLLPVQPPGPHWGVAGYSEGGYCAANLALRHPDRYAAAAALSGYFVPQPYVRVPARIDPFHGDGTLRTANTPMAAVARTPGTVRIPHFWIMSGDARADDLRAARQFTAMVHRHGSDARLTLVSGGTHSFNAWRQALPGMLDWLTTTIAVHRPGSR